MNIVEYNRSAWNKQSSAGSEWCTPVNTATIARARHPHPNPPGAEILVRRSLRQAPAVPRVVDVADLEAALSEGPAAAIERAVPLYAGHFLESFVLDEEPFDDWRRAEAERLRRHLPHSGAC